MVTRDAPADLVNWRQLLDGIANGLREFDHAPTSCLEVAFCDEDSVLWKGGVVAALDAIANDLYWNEDGDYRDADRAEVRVL